jgi:aspartokinase/homoserine dehydrogenase 1
VSSIHDLALVTIEGRGMSGVPGVARRVFDAAERARVNVVMISQASSEQTITFVVPGSDAGRMIAELEQAFAMELAAGAVDRVSARKDVAVLSIVGRGMAGTPGISGNLFNALGSVKVNVLAIAQGSSELSISVAVGEDEARKAVRAVHSAFGLTRIINVVMLGAGRVGRTLLRQLEETRGGMQAKLGLELRLVGLANSRHLLWDDGGLVPARAAEELTGSPSLPPRPELIQQLLAGRFTDLVLVDLTAADTAALQLEALEAGIHVVTANKLPLSGSQAHYEGLQHASRSTGASLNYETTFGAGLPVLHSLQELINTGDHLKSITGCFSGTLGFICTRLEEGVPLTEAVRAAQEQGLTEPDPREDLSGRDVARKALIIARTAGMQLEPDEVELAPLVPDLDQGLEQALALHGEALTRRVAEEREQGRVFRYTAEITPQRVKVGLQSLPVGDPIGALRGEDNMLVYRTERYNELPLVIRGPGAGAEVTAAGVLGDVLKVAGR